jgi:hypothetical protein
MVILFDISKKLRANTIAMERVGAAVRMSVRTSAILIENFHGLNQTLRANAEIVLPLLHDSVLPDPLQYMIQATILLYSLRYRLSPNICLSSITTQSQLYNFM